MKPKKWECESVDKQYVPTPDREMEQRLAEILEVLLTGSRQLPRDRVFTKDQIIPWVPSVQPKQKGA